MNDAELDRLQRFFDDELEGDDARRIQSQIEADPDWSAAHATLAATRSALRAHMEAEVEAADFSGLWAAVEAALPERPEHTPAPRVTAAPPAPSPWDRISVWWAAHWTPVVVSAAAAALIAVLVTQAMGPAARPERGGVASLVAEFTATDDAQVVVDAVRNEGDKTVLINMPAGADDATVIWLLDDEQGEDDNSITGEDPI